jgi:hypothetical protein
MARHLKDRKTIPAPRLNLPRIHGADGNAGFAS